MDDSEIVRLFFLRDESALQLSSEKYGKRLRALSYGIVGDSLTAEECENDTYVQAWSSIPPHNPQDHLYAFLARITRHISLNCCRARNCLKRSAYICELSYEMEQCIPAPDDCESRLNDMVFADFVNGFLASLSAEKRIIFLRRYWYLDSISDIAGHLGCSEGKVKTILLRLRVRLREKLIKEGYDL